MKRHMLTGGATLGVATALLLSPAPALAQASAPAVQRVPVSAVEQAPAPKTVAKKLFKAWVAGDRRAALKVGTPSAVAGLFAYVYRAPDEFRGCVGNACRFVHTSVRVPGGLNGIMMIVNGHKVTKVYRSRHVTKPSTAARYLFRAWQKGDRNRGLEVASNKAVDTVFRVRFDPAGVAYHYQGCTPEPKGQRCAYSYEGGAMLMHLRGSAVRGWAVQSVSYIAD